MEWAEARQSELTPNGVAAALRDRGLFPEIDNLVPSSREHRRAFQPIHPVPSASLGAVRHPTTLYKYRDISASIDQTVTSIAGYSRKPRRAETPVGTSE